MRLRLPLPQGFRPKALASTTAPSRSERPPRAHIWGAHSRVGRRRRRCRRARIRTRPARHAGIGAETRLNPRFRRAGHASGSAPAARLTPSFRTGRACRPCRATAPTTQCNSWRRAAHRALGGAPPASASIRPCARGFRTEPGSVRAPASILSGTDFHIEPHAEFRAGFRPNPARALAPNLTRIHVAVPSIFWQHLCETYYKLPYPLSNLFHGQA